MQDQLNYINIFMQPTLQINYLYSKSDSDGGYIHHVLLPVARFAFYSGNISFRAVNKVSEIFKELKAFLHTDGKTWRAPITDFSSFCNEIRPLVYTDVNKPCDQLIFYENMDDNNERDAHSLFVPMPYLDEDKHPHAIAVPFKNHLLRNIQEYEAAYILVKYFITVTKCLEEKQASYASTCKFYKRFDEFLEQKVMKLLDDDRFYAAFGGVYRIKKTMKFIFDGQALPEAFERNRTRAVTDPVMIASNPIVDSNASTISIYTVDSDRSEDKSEKKLVKRESIEFDDFSGFNSYSDDYAEIYEEKKSLRHSSVSETARYKLMFLIMTIIVAFLFFVCLIMACLYFKKKKECDPPKPPPRERPHYKCNEKRCEDKKYSLVHHDSCLEWDDAKPPCPSRGFLERLKPEDSTAAKKRRKSLRDRFKNLLLSQSAHAYPTKANAPCNIECKQPCNISVPEPHHRQKCPSDLQKKSNCNLIDHIYMDSCTTDSSPRTTSPCSNASRKSYGFGRKKSSQYTNEPCKPCGPCKP